MYLLIYNILFYLHVAFHLLYASSRAGTTLLVLASASLGLPGCHDKTPAPDLCQGPVANPLTLHFLEAFGT
jgi:hypothetical protein